MISSLKFVQGAIAKKELVAGLTHFKIKDNRITSYNGVISLSSPILLDIECCPKAEPMIKAIASCTDTVQLTLTKANKLSIKSGPFKVTIECTAEAVPEVEPEGTTFEVDGDVLLKALTAVEPFIGTDASRPWSRGVLFSNASAYATCNVIAVEYWHGITFPHSCNVPREAVKEMLRLKKPPVRVQLSDKSITFHYEDGEWLRSSLLDLDYPNIDNILNVESLPQEVDTSLFTGLETIKPFSDKHARVYIENGNIRTHFEVGEGANYQIADTSMVGVYNIDILLLLKKQCQ